ncbi:MAG: ribbon-helix-helix protein, CopG family [Nocardioides sp.]
MALTLRTDKELDDALSSLSAAEKLSKQEVIRRAVLDRHAALDRRARLQAVLDSELPRYAEALERLGE